MLNLIRKSHGLWSLAFLLGMTSGLLSSFMNETQAAYPHTRAGRLPLYVDLRDLSTDPGVAIILNSMRGEPLRYFPRGVRFSGRGATYAGSPERTRSSHQNSVFGIELYEAPVDLGGGVREYRIIAMAHSAARRPSDRHFFRRFHLVVDLKSNEVTRVEVIGDVLLSQTRFKIAVGLIDRKAVLIDAERGITKIYPLGVGGFDEGVTRSSHGGTQLLTPLFKNAKLTPDAALFARKAPWYFKDRPFIRLVRSDGAWTTVAFHAMQNRVFVRGFDSHGCMRLRDKDLYELYYIVHGQNRDSDRPSPIVIDIANRIDFDGKHPYPLSNGRYKRVKNFGTPGAPEEKRECESLPNGSRPRNCRYKLSVMETRYARPPIERIQGQDGDAMQVPELMHFGAGDFDGLLPAID